VTQAISNDPENWRTRAAEARAMAEQLSDARAKQAILDIAKSCEQLAEHLEQRQSENGQAAKPD
jgi:hypothetical protein